MNRLFTAIVLLLVASCAWAESGSLTQAQQFASTLAPPTTDYSVAYLSQIFGTVGNVLQSTSGQILGQMFDIFNKGVLVVAALYLAYNIVLIAMRAASEGSFMGQNRNVAFVFLRIAFGFALIIPSSATGYSFLQDIFMKVVVEGVGLADQTWDAALQYMRYGGELYIPPATLSNDTSIISNAVGSGQRPNSVTNILQDEVCMLKSQQWEKEVWKKNNPGKTAPFFDSYHPVFDPTVNNYGIVYFPGVGNSVSAGPTAYLTTANSTSGSPAFPACGYATAYVPSSLPSTASAGLTAAAQAYSYSALKQVVISLLPAAQALADHPNSAADVTQEAGQNNIKTVFSGILAYANLITPLQQILNSTTGATGRRAFIPTAEAQGWIMAGGFYWNLEQANKKSASISIGSLLPSAPPLANMTASIYPTYSNALSSIPNTVMNVYAESTPPAGLYTLPTLWTNYVGAQQNKVVATSSGTTSAPSPGLAGTLESSMFGEIVSGSFDLSSASAYNPIVTLMNLGNKLLEACAGIWIAAIGLSIAAAAVAGICTSTSPGGVIIKAILTWLKSIVMLISTLLMVPGATLAYYVPMYPFAVFTFAAVGWFLMVIEGMAAAPLICLGVTHPEGHDFLGKAEQALMLFLSIFLRPALMVLGMVAAMVISFVAFHMLISGFGNVIQALEAGSGALSDMFLILISICMVMIIFGMMTMELIEQCYKLIFQLPQYILKWIGGPETGADYGQMASAIKGGVSSGASGFGQAATEPVKAAGDKAESEAAKGKEERERKARESGSGDIQGGGG